MKKNIKIVMLGDSITGRGDWKKLLEEEKLINLGLDGDTTTGILNRINIIGEIEPKIVFLMAGINDLCLSIPLKDIFKNYKNILEKLESFNTKIIVQATLLTQMPTVNKKVKIFNNMLEEYCLSKKILFINLNKSFSNEEGLLKEELTIDGLHLGQKAYVSWAYKLKRELTSI
ncbi:MAG: GDSL-type esterase/lipase family protein [Halarcobacter sp.]